mgnify:CR=1 FL=1
MLSRVADNLFWFGRYIERTEHLCRFLRVQYFSSLESPLEIQNEMALHSIMSMVGMPVEENHLLEEDVLLVVAMDESNPSSIKSTVQQARENARGARDLISTELFNIVNKFYRFTHDYPEEYYKTRGLYDFTQTNIENCAIIKHNIQNTLLHDEIWAFINMGLHLERAAQICRIIISKLENYYKLEEMKASATIMSYQLGVLLRSCEGLDMYRRTYKTSPVLNNTLEFLVLNPDFPRSILYNITKFQEYLAEIWPYKQIRKNSIEWKIGRIKEYLTYSTVEDFEKKPIEFVEKTLDYLYNLTNMLSKEYLSY